MPTTDKRPLKVFLCHAHSDKDTVKALYTRLTNDGMDAWLDKEKLLPGQDWELEIKKAVREADVVVVCLSKQFNQAGFRQKEVRLALDTAMEKPEGEIFIIPARLDECDNLESLKKWHWVDLFEDNGYEMLLRALRARADNVNVNSLQTIKNHAMERKSFALAQDSLNDIQESKANFGGNVSDSVIILGNNNVLSLNANPMPLQKEKEEDEQFLSPRVFGEIKKQIEFRLYREAYKRCVALMSRGENSALINLLAGISYTLDKGEKKLRDNDMQIINKYISLAVRDNNVRPTALAVLGCIKYSYCYLNKLHDSSNLTLEFIKEELRKNSGQIDRKLLNLIDPTEYALKFLEIL
jgi:hypothetical protein